MTYVTYTSGTPIRSHDRYSFNIATFRTADFVTTEELQNPVRGVDPVAQRNLFGRAPESEKDRPFQPKHLHMSNPIASCCGAYTLSNFPEYHRHYIGEDKKTLVPLYKYSLLPKKSDAEVKKEVEADMVHFLQSPPSCLFVILTEKQQRVWHDLLTKYDFKVINEGFHTYSYLSLITYCRNRYVPAAKEGHFKDTALSKKQREPVRELKSEGGKDNIDAWEAGLRLEAST